jgi:hypothetical protein
MWVGVPPILYLWEAEDFDFSNGQYFNEPDLCNSPGSPNCYYGTVGVEGADEQKLGGGNNHWYRPEDAVSIGIAGDRLRPDLYAAERTDFRIDPFLGDQVVVSFPTVDGLIYRILQRDHLAAGDWTLLESVHGDGSVMSVSDPLTAGQRFYQLSAP